MSGLRGPVKILTDGYGVPYIEAETLEDLFFAQGYVTARDRLFQIDYNRHAARGRICELVGDQTIPWRGLTVHLKDRTTLDVDVMVRTFGMERTAERSWSEHSSATRDVLSAYTAGINRYLEEGYRTLEHRILRLRPKPWRETDSLALLKGIGFELNYAWRSILLTSMIASHDLSEAQARALWPKFPEFGSAIVTSLHHDPQVQALLEDARQTRAAARVISNFDGATGSGSNAWAVAGSHTASGDALMANDTHLAMQAPSPWHEVHLKGGGLDLSGFALAGVPGISIGRTPHHGWGITAGLVQDLDLFVEEVRWTNDAQVRTVNGWKDLDRRSEVFEVRGGTTQSRDIYSSSHGPLLSTVGPVSDHRRLAVCWTGLEPSCELETLWGLWTGTSRSEFEAALAKHGCPTYNVTYAGADSRVAYFLAGKIPKRKIGTPMRVLEGWTDQWDWEGRVPFLENPRELDPKRGFVVSANNRVAGRDYPHELGPLFEPSYRYDRIVQRLLALGRGITFQDMVSLQNDAHGAWALAARDTLIEALGGARGLEVDPQSWSRVALELWLAWDGIADPDSAGAAVAYTVPHHVAHTIVECLTDADTALAWLEMSSFILPKVGDPTEFRSFTRGLVDRGLSVRRVVQQGIQRGLAFCRATLGEDPERWRWGILHPLVCRHRFHESPLGPLFSLGPIPAAGGPDTINRGDFNSGRSFELRVGPAMRWVANAKKREEAGTVLPGGQSGSVLSSHFSDQLPLFLAGSLKSAPADSSSTEIFRAEEWRPTSQHHPSGSQEPGEP